MQRKLSASQRVISGALAILVIMMSYLLPLVIPLTDQSNGVLNARAAENSNESNTIGFFDTSWNAIDTVENGKTFYLKFEIVGNSEDKNKNKGYQLAISDDNLILNNFSNNEYSYQDENGVFLNLLYILGKVQSVILIWKLTVI
ncbi:MAG: hypothetical protein K2G36_00015 [Ruminococcus sp.]|nr:hypothetical protein [Ruminococcus sp.]